MRNLEQDLRDALNGRAVLSETLRFDDIWSIYQHEPTVRRKGRKGRKKWLVVGIPVILVLGGMTAAATTIVSNYAQSLKTATQGKGIFEYVNGKPISNQEFQSFKVNQDLIAQLSHKSVLSEGEIIRAFNLQQVAYQEAEKENLSVTDQQALHDSLQMQQTMEHPPSDADKANFAKALAILKAEEKGLGVSDTQYWTQAAPPAYKMAMSIGNLKQHFFTHYRTEHPGAQFQTIQDAWNQYNDKLLNQATMKQIGH